MTGPLGAILGQRDWGQWPHMTDPASFKAVEDIWTFLIVMDIIHV